MGVEKQVSDKPPEFRAIVATSNGMKVRLPVSRLYPPTYTDLPVKLVRFIFTCGLCRQSVAPTAEVITGLASREIGDATRTRGAAARECAKELSLRHSGCARS